MGNGLDLERGNGPTILERITELARQINCLDMDRIARVCLETIPGLTRARFGSIYVLDDHGHVLHLLKHNHPYAINRMVGLDQTPRTPMITAVKTRDLVVIHDMDGQGKPAFRKSQRPNAGNYETHNCVIVPLICQDRVVGVLNLADRLEGPFGPEEVALVGLFGQLIGAAIGNIKLFEKMQHEAITDGLTGLVNHRAFYDILERELWRSRRYGGKISLIMVDVDNLKTVNDTYGHRAGDHIIKEISRRIGRCIRQIDTAARYGGDEFAVILPSTSLAEAIVVAERMVRAVSATPTVWDRQSICLSVSVGVGQYDAQTNPQDMTSRSDRALYVAKQAGKNTVRVFTALDGHV